MSPLVLASGSPIRRALLAQAGLSFEVQSARIDEASLQQALMEDSVPSRDMADALAEFKASRVSQARPEALVIGADQTLEVTGETIFKSPNRASAASLLQRLQGQSFKLHSAAVVFEEVRPILAPCFKRYPRNASPESDRH